MRSIVLALFLVAQACTAQSSPRHSIRASVRPNDSVKVVASLPWVSDFTPPPIYEEWFNEITACEHSNAPPSLFRSIRWIVVNSRTFHLGIADADDKVFGFADVRNNTIYVAMGSQLEKEVVQHEIMHVVDYANGVDEGDDYHPFDTFEACGLHVHHA